MHGDAVSLGTSGGAHGSLEPVSPQVISPAGASAVARLALWFLLLLQWMQLSNNHIWELLEKKGLLFSSPEGDIRRSSKQEWEWGPLLGSKVGVVKQGPRTGRRGGPTWLPRYSKASQKENVMGESRLGAYLEVVIQLQCVYTRWVSSK